MTPVLERLIEEFDREALANKIKDVIVRTLLWGDDPAEVWAEIEKQHREDV